ncbi:MAG: HAD-IIA family hydrolase [Chloroflexi bacterium]|nr:HAD-IIA family hydrolase [Chloroflexota bacterium]MBI3763453.1 HAD-IIA family hydrolase [Chloroflexota bacterium]
MSNLASIRHLIIDMDGVLWEGDRPLPGLVGFFATLRRLNITFVLATNNASQTPEQYIAKCARMGVEISRDEILSSAQATALYLSQQSSNGARVFALGEDGVRNALTERGFSLCNLYEVNAQYVVCGMDRGLSWDKLATATLNIRAGAKFIGTNPDTTLPTERGITHGNGAILAALQTATGVAPTLIGKPEPIMYQQAMARLGGTTGDTWALGDRLETDILGAIRAGIRSILVMSGIATPEQLAASDYQPDIVLPGILELTAELNRA